MTLAKLTRKTLSALGHGVLALIGISLASCMPGRSYVGPLPALNGEELELSGRIAGHVRTLSEDIGPRTVMAGRYEALLRAESYIAETLAGFGYETSRQTYEVAGKEVANIEAVLPGTGQGLMIVGAHYDTVSMTPGADDNASAVAMLLELARLARENGPHAMTLRFVAFVNEEPPFFQTPDMGSRRYAARCRMNREKLDAVIVLESLGYYDTRPDSQHYPMPLSLFYPDTGDFVAFVGNIGSRGLAKEVTRLFRESAEFPSEAAVLPGWLSGVGWSDQWSFWKEGYEAVMVTDTAPFRNPNYHKPSDTPDTLDYERTARVALGLFKVIRALAEEQGKKAEKAA